MRSRRGKLVVLLGAALAAGLGGLAVVTNHDRVYRWWWNWTRGVSVVSTWRDLRREPEIVLEGNGSVRLGIEATRAPAGRGVLVYCRVEKWPSGALSNLGEPLGPLRVTIEKPGGREPTLAKALRELPRGTPALFARAVPLEKPGIYKVTIRDRGGTELRSNLIEATPAPYHRWVPLRPSPPVPKFYTSLRVENPAGPAVIPAWEGTSPIPGETTAVGERFPRDGPLPPLVPESPDPSVRLEVSTAEEALILTLTADAAVFETPRLGDRLLARWWVNDGPWQPGKRYSVPLSESLQNGERVSRTDTARIQLAFDPSRFGARSGDRIGLQLLYFSNGWMYTEPRARLMRMRHKTEPRAHMSNRVEFTVP